MSEELTGLYSGRGHGKSKYQVRWLEAAQKSSLFLEKEFLDEPATHQFAYEFQEFTLLGVGY